MFARQALAHLMLTWTTDRVLCGRSARGVRVDFFFWDVDGRRQSQGNVVQVRQQEKGRSHGPREYLPDPGGSWFQSRSNDRIVRIFRTPRSPRPPPCSDQLGAFATALGRSALGPRRGTFNVSRREPPGAR